MWFHLQVVFFQSERCLLLFLQLRFQGVAKHLPRVKSSCTDYLLNAPAACPCRQISESWRQFFYPWVWVFFSPIYLIRVFRGKGRYPKNDSGVPLGRCRRHHSLSLTGPTITKTSQEVLCHHTLSSGPVYPMDLGFTTRCHLLLFAPWIWGGGFFASPMGYIFGDLGQGVHICGAVLPHEVILKISWFGCRDTLLPFSSPWYLFPFFTRKMGATAPVWPIPKVQPNKDHLSHSFRHQQHGWLGWAEQRANAQ